MTDEATPLNPSAHNRKISADMRRQRMASQRTGANIQMALPKIRQPLGSLQDKGIPFNTEDPKELSEARKLCNTPDAPVWMADYSFKPIGEIQPGDQVIGWVTEDQPFDRWGEGHTRRKRILTRTTVLAVNRRMAPEVVKITFESGKVIKCTPDHEWLRYYPPNAKGIINNGPEQSWSKRFDSEYAPLQVGSVARFVMGPTQPLTDPEKLAAAHYLAGIIDGEGSWRNSTITFAQSRKVNPDVVEKIDKAIETLGLSVYRYERVDHKPNNLGYQQKDFIVWDLSSGAKTFSESCTDSIRIKNRQQLVDLYNWTHPAKMDIERMDKSLLSSRFGVADTVVSIESLGPSEVVSMQTTTGNYTAWGYASKNCRLYYRTHDLVPLLIDIYSKFPVTGLEFQSKDPLIERFYTDMFMNDLNYAEYLPDCLGREYFTVGEVNSLGHFNESLGVWSSEEVIDPDMIRVSKSLFVQQERVQLLVKDLVERLRSGPQGILDTDESPSERMERTWEYQELVKNYPEVIKAAAQDDGLDISDALISRLVNRCQPNDLRGTPHLLRSFRTLMMEESLNAAQDAVADRLYAPLILATLGIENMGDGEPWIPAPSDLDELRDDMQAALAADFKLMVHNFGLQVQNVFGRESVPRFDQDYQRIDSKLLQAWGIGEALIAGGTTGTYASSALNREVCEQLMLSFQNAIRRHIIKRAEVIAEAQGHFDYEIKGGIRKPLYREIVEYDPETGEEIRRRVPKLLIPEIHFSVLNLRDESTERAFVAQLKASGVPISDKMMAMNLPIDFAQELQRSTEESVAKWISTAEALDKAQKLCDARKLPYPPDLAEQLTATLMLRQQLAQTDILEGQGEMQDAQMRQMSPAGQLGLLPGTVPLPPVPPEEGDGQQKSAAIEPDPTGVPHSQPPKADAPQVSGPFIPPPVEIPRNRIRPPESDDQRKDQPKNPAGHNASRFAAGPSSYGQSHYLSEAQVEQAVRRMEAVATHRPGSSPRVEDLIEDPEFYAALNLGPYEAQIRADWPEIQAGGAKESAALLREAIEQYEDVFGTVPEW